MASLTTYFVSGHLDLSEAEFAQHYVPQLTQYASEPQTQFIVGTARGADSMALHWLLDNGAHITVCHKSAAVHPAWSAEFESCTARIHAIVGGFDTDEARDTYMTAHSDADIAWVRPMTPEIEARLKAELGKRYKPGRVSGTQKNLDRRHAHKT